MVASVDKMGETIIDVPPLSFGATFKTIPPLAGAFPSTFRWLEPPEPDRPHISTIVT